MDEIYLKYKAPIKLGIISILFFILIIANPSLRDFKRFIKIDIPELSIKNENRKAAIGRTSYLLFLSTYKCVVITKLNKGFSYSSHTYIGFFNNFIEY